ncbi:hypothetical protein SDC9_178325 [bioreactor metagenome]|uniref:Uncharacterized protein n=1 Tax=bioreactor metagenome TaxID=1076179 RepID=A0A645H3G3_9ZZZZ
MRFYELSCGRSEPHEVFLQPDLLRACCLRQLPALEDFFCNQVLECFQAWHMLVERHVADAQCSGNADKRNARKADGNSGVCNLLSGDGAWSPTSRGLGCVGHTLVLSLWARLSVIHITCRRPIA